MNNTALNTTPNNKIVDVAFSWVREDFVDFLLEKVNPTLALKRILATVKAVEPLGDNMVKVVLRPNKKFLGFNPGQFVLLTVKMFGSYQQRCYSVVSFDKGVLTLGVKAQGKVSEFIAGGLTPGSVVEISQAQGSFTLQNLNQPMLFIASGSGITPVMALVQHAATNSTQPITLIYYSREHVFTRELRELAANHAELSVHLVNTLTAHEHFNEKNLLGYCPDYKSRQTYVCGAAGLMADVSTLWKNNALSKQLHTEYFAAPASDGLVEMPVTFRRSITTFNATGSLLLSAESAGLKPAHGCRRGVCNTCVCTKVSGTVRNQLTGELNHAPNSQIKLCINEAVTPVEIDL